MSNHAETQADIAQPARSIGQIIARNTIFGVGGQLALRIANFIFTVLVVRTLGDQHFGQYSIVLAWAGLFSVIGDLGINQYLAREIARDKNQSNALFWDTVVLRLILAVIATLTTIGGALLLTDYSPTIIVGIGLYTATYYFSALVAPLQSILTGHERLDVLTVMNVISQVIFMIFAGLFLFLGLDFIWLILAGLIAMPIVAVLQYQVIKRNRLGPPVFRLNRGMWWTLIRAGMPFAAVQLSLTFAFHIDTIFLAQYTNDAVVGWYGAAYRLTLTFLSLSRSFNDAILPTLAQEHASNPDTVRRWYYTSTRFIIMIGLPIAVGGSILSGGIVNIYGEAFLPSTIAFAILIWDIPFVMYHSFCGNIATSIRQEGSAARIYMSVGILNIALNALLVPRFGIIAACFATVITDAFGAGLFYALLRRELGPGLRFNRLIWLGVAAVGMAALVYFLHDFNIFVAAGIGGICYLCLVWVLPALSKEERANFIDIAGRLGRRLRPHFLQV